MINVFLKNSLVRVINLNRRLYAWHKLTENLERHIVNILLWMWQRSRMKYFDTWFLSLIIIWKIKQDDKIARFTQIDRFILNTTLHSCLESLMECLNIHALNITILELFSHIRFYNSIEKKKFQNCKKNDIIFLFYRKINFTI